MLNRAAPPQIAKFVLEHRGIGYSVGFISNSSASRIENSLLCFSRFLEGTQSSGSCKRRMHPMNTMTHTRGFGSGVQMLDRDHQAIAELLIELNNLAVHESCPNLQMRLVKELKQLTATHFALEDGIMSSINYPGLAEHRQRHRLMMEQVGKVAAKWGSRAPSTFLESMGLLWEEHVLHVENEDMNFGNWLNGFRTPKNNVQ
jgi:hemerythrin-like metal-binding protein